MESRRCAACGQAFRPRPQVSHQCYCPAPACQRERRRCWQQAKHKSDSDYRDNQALEHSLENAGQARRAAGLRLGRWRRSGDHRQYYQRERGEPQHSVGAGSFPFLSGTRRAADGAGLLVPRDPQPRAVSITTSPGRTTAAVRAQPDA